MAYEVELPAHIWAIIARSLGVFCLLLHLCAQLIILVQMTKGRSAQVLPGKRRAYLLIRTLSQINYGFRICERSYLCKIGQKKI